MTTMETTISNNSDWNNMLSDQLFDFDDLFSSAFSFIHSNEYDEDPMSIREEYDEISSSSEVKIIKRYLFNVYFILFRLIKNNCKHQLLIILHKSLSRLI
jgi:hypothetical protein